jgi:hypothetical protein
MSHFELLEERLSTHAGEGLPTREGLPASYRMRHDQHYVDHVMAQPAARPVAEAERLGAEARRTRPTLGLSALLLTLRDLAERLGGIEACISLMAAGERSTRERLALDLMRIETQRCAWLGQALALLAEEPFLVRTDFAASALLERSLAQLDAERRLTGAEIAVDVARAPLMIRGDHRLLTVALAVAGASVLSIATRAKGARLRARLQPGGGGSAALFEISQEQVSVPEWALARFFDPDWTDRPGGALLGLALAGARRAAELHGGRFEIGGGRGAAAR